MVCGSYVIGKEKIWLALANEFALTVWTEPNRSIAAKCLQLPDLEAVLTDDPRKANLHVITMGKVSYPVGPSILTYVYVLYWVWKRF